jgi:hypothetical protein
VQDSAVIANADDNTAPWFYLTTNAGNQRFF